MSASSDCAGLFAHASRALGAETLRGMFGHGAWLYRHVFGLWPVEGAGRGFWQPAGGKPSPDSFALIVAVRAGRDWLDGAPPACVEVDPVHRTPTAAGSLRLRGWSALFGPDVLDLLAFDLALSRPPRRLTGYAGALGFGASGEYTVEGDPPVRVVGDLAEWLRHAVDGACLPLGQAIERAALLRGFQGGIVARDVAHGDRLQRVLKVPPIEVPGIFVERDAA